MKKIISLVLCIILLASVAVFASSCGEEKPTVSDTSVDTQIDTAGDIAEEDEVRVVKTFMCIVVDETGAENKFEITSDRKYVGDALVDVELIEGEEGPYGMYVKAVDGKSFDYDTDKKYWAFYIDGERAATGVDTTEITDGSTYTFKVES